MGMIQYRVTLLASNSVAGTDGDQYTYIKAKGCCRQIKIHEIPQVGYVGGVFEAQGLTYKLGSDNFANVFPFPAPEPGGPPLLIGEEIPENKGCGRPIGFPQIAAVGQVNYQPATVVAKVASASQNTTDILVREYS